MQKEDFKPFVGKTIQHKYSERTALLMTVEEGVNGGLRIQWIGDKYQISLPSGDFQLVKEAV